MESRLAESVVGLLDEHFVDRVVLEMDELERLHSELIGELMQIRKGVAERGGVVRISGLSDSGCESLRTCNLDSHLPPYPTKQDAVMARVDPPAAPVAPHQTSKLAKSNPRSS